MQSQPVRKANPEALTVSHYTHPWAKIRGLFDGSQVHAF